MFNDISARKKLERQIAEVSDREQRRIGEDLHDGLCQHLVSTAFAARKLAAKLAEQSLPEARRGGARSPSCWANPSRKRGRWPGGFTSCRWKPADCALRSKNS